MRFSFLDPIEESSDHKCDAIVSREYRTLINYGFRRESPIFERDHVIKCECPATHAYMSGGWTQITYRCNHHALEDGCSWRRITLKEALCSEVLDA